MSGHHDFGAVTACSVEPCAVTPQTKLHQSSAAMCSSPHVRFFVAISTMSRWTSMGMRGARWRDFTR